MKSLDCTPNSTDKLLLDKHIPAKIIRAYGYSVFRGEVHNFIWKFYTTKLDLNIYPKKILLKETPVYIQHSHTQMELDSPLTGGSPSNSTHWVFSDLAHKMLLLFLR